MPPRRRRWCLSVHLVLGKFFALQLKLFVPADNVFRRWPNDLANFPTEKQAELADFLFNEDGLWLTSYRYNLGATGDHDSHVVFNAGRGIESPMLTNGSYDWSRDLAGRRFLQYANNHSVPYITVFLNAVPSGIAANQRAFGYDFQWNATVPFAQYIATVLSHFIDEEGIRIASVSPMNEPDYLHPFGDQEGGTFGPDKRGTIFAVIKQELEKTSAKNVEIMGDETSQPVGQGAFTFSQWLNSSTVLSNLAVHNYEFPTDAELLSFYKNVYDLTDGNPPPVKFTETCCAISAGNGPQIFGRLYDPGMGNALIVARQIWQFLHLAQAVSFDWWTAVSYLPCSPSVDGIQCSTAYNTTAGFNDAVVYIDGNYAQTKDYNFYYTKRTWMLKHFATFHRPGAVRHAVDQSVLPDSVNAIASLSNGTANGSTLGRAGVWNILFMNNATEPQNIQFQVPDACDILTQIVETSPVNDFAKLPIIPNVLQTGVMNLTLPAQSIWSLQFAKAA